jgi:hypothetical protein
MAFSGLTTHDFRSADLIQESIGRLVTALSPKETPFLDFLGDAPDFAIDTEHKFIEDYMLPNYIVNSTAINSATAATGFQINGLGLALSVGQLLEIEHADGPEVMQISSIPGANSLLVTRNYGGGGVGSLAVGGSIYVREAAGITGQDHSGSDVHRLGVKKANTVGLFRMELAESLTAAAISTQGNDRWSGRVTKTLIDVMHQLEKAVVRGKLNSSNSLASTTTTRTMKGLRESITSVNSTVAASSFAANPHKYVGDVWEQMWRNGASDSETWAIVAGSTFFRDLSNLNDTKVQDSNASELFQRVIRQYAGPFGQATLFPSRVLPATELLILPKERVRVVQLNGRSFRFDEMARTGDNRKGLVVGEYTLEVHHESGMARLRV